MKVHFAAGVHAPKFSPRQGWWNVDFEQGPGIQQRVNLLAEDWPDNLADITVAYVGHFLEHLWPDEAVTFLERVLKRMAPGGQLVVVGPDAHKGKAMHDRGQIPASLLAQIKAHGDPNGDDRGACHLWDCTEDVVVQQAMFAGWQDVRAQDITRMRRVTPGVPVISTAAWQLLVTATA